MTNTTVTKTIVPVIVAGDPSLTSTTEQIIALSEAGAKLVAISVPFSDPVGDGPVIQAADVRALAAGTNLPGIFTAIEAARTKTQVPLQLTIYANLAYKYGDEKFAKKCASLGVTDVLVLDLPSQEDDPLPGALAAAGVNLVTVVTTNSLGHVAPIVAAAKNYIFVMPIPGSGPEATAAQLQQLVPEIRQHTDLPVIAEIGLPITPVPAPILDQVDGVYLDTIFPAVAAEAGQDAPAKLQAAFKQLQG
ncbi:tryptophan synthase subunit alpha [Schleiferilactobacillus harbinensis]|uniref:tryptophan synthase subunit alpha n=1 Tax=Schleiferilactobacillus harbinensis TaxID=304207 RepID=UPI001238ADF1|nr:tryptophan synthase subunit alpha [Schleiferilactobacillus harbinensis]QEU46006.1 tryptophan synthase subunit alpha [Schleiferilactobacillus harbinensis]